MWPSGCSKSVAYINTSLIGLVARTFRRDSKIVMGLMGIGLHKCKWTQCTIFRRYVNNSPFKRGIGKNGVEQTKPKLSNNVDCAASQLYVSEPIFVLMEENGHLCSS